MHHQKPMPGAAFPPTLVPLLGGGTHELGAREGRDHWKLIVVYRGLHCPVCTRYLTQLNAILPDLEALSIDVVAVSADSAERAAKHMAQVNPAFAVAHDLSVAQMQALGLYISGPRNGMDVERPFAEPGLFVVNEEGDVRIADISNVPFARPELQSLLGGLKFLRGMTSTFPTNGTFA